MYQLPELPYSYDSLEPHISSQTLQIHHGKHHAAYTNKLNSLLEKYPEIMQIPIVELLINFDSVIPAEINQSVKPQAGQYFNHNLYWESMSPNSSKEPVGSLAEEIKSQFGGFDSFKSKFAEVGASQFGSGWAWLSMDEKKNLIIEKTSNEDCPLFHGRMPILTMDVWEHAYYLDYQNRRPDYIQNFFNVIDWEAAEKRFVNSIK